MDVVVPHTRTMADMLEILDVLVADDPETRGDFWRAQPWIRIPRCLGHAAVVISVARLGRRRHRSRHARWPPVRRAAHVHQRRRGCRHGPRRRDRRPHGDAHRDPRIGDRALGAGAPRPRSGRRRRRRGRLPRRDELRGRPPGAPTIAHARTGDAGVPRAARSSTCRRGRGTTSCERTATRRSTGSTTSTAPRSSRTRAARCPTATPASTTTSRPTRRRCARIRTRRSPTSPSSRRRARPRRDPAPIDLEEWMDGPRPRRRGLPRRRRRRPGRHGRERGVGRPRLAQRRMGRQRQPRDPPPRHPDGHGADGDDGRHRHAGGPDVRRPCLHDPALLAWAAAFEALRPRRTTPPRTPEL